jgi:dCMP deaminase
MREVAMKEKHLIAFMQTAYAFADCSTARRLKVGCVIVKDNRIISIGYNGTPVGWDNNCESELYTTDADDQPKLITRPQVLHAESNAIAKLARCTESGEGATLVCTHAPCIDCSKLILQTGIACVIYSEEYRSIEGLNFLNEGGVQIIQCKVEFDT